ncbi:protein NLRC3 isoform X2 [Misgurnus anguillicaudatus]|uniref:protein NLRC3 isoform X2 n=1 Tax=Misgurnus anguillicaudatus TaxID=75329 RepID=UPI003CCF4E52
MADELVRDCSVVQVHSSKNQETPASPSPSHESIKSDQSMNHPRDFKGSSLLQPGGSDFLNEFKKSNQSMDHLVEFKESSSVPQGRSASPCPSHESMKSNQSMNHPRDLKGSSPELQNSNQSMDHLVEFKESRTDLSTKETLRSHLRNKCQCLHEGTIKNIGLIPLNEIYTEVYITEGWCGEINNEHEVRQIEAALRRASTKDKPIKCNDILKPLLGQDNPIRTVLTKGVAGIGKTVCVQKFILDWAEGKANQDINLIFPLPFRELNLMKDQKVSLIDLLQLFTHIEQLEISQNKSKILLILDGLDECRLLLDFDNSVRLCDVNELASVDVLVTNLIKGNLLPSALIWITSRPSAADLIPSECFDRVTEVRGFSDPQKEEYFRKRISDEGLADKIVSHLKSSRSLYIMCHIPVFCWISVTVLDKMLKEAEREEIPKTLTQMYTHFLIIQINIKNEKDYERKVSDEVMILKLGKLAFQQLQKGNLIFYEEDLRQCDIDVQEASVFSGLCTQIFREESGLFQGKAYCFVHLSVQEHLAALYVYLSFMNKHINVFDQPKVLPNVLACTHGSRNSIFALHQTVLRKALHSVNGHLDLFLRFFVGFSLESNQILLQNLFTQPEKLSYSKKRIAEMIKMKIDENPSTEKSINLFHCLNELNDHYLVEDIQDYLKSDSKLNKTLSPSQWSAVVFILLTSGRDLDLFDLDKYVKKNISANEALQRLQPVIEASRTTRLCGHSFSQKGCATLVSVLNSKTSCMRELFLTESNIKDEGLKQLCTGLANNKCQLEILGLSRCGITHEGFAALASALRSNPSHLQELDLSGNLVTNYGVNLLSAELRNPHCKLERLLIRNCGITDEGCAALASALRSNPSHLRELNLSKNKLGDSGIKQLSDALKSPNCKLETLLLMNCGITHEGCAALASALRSTISHLRQLDLSGNNLTNRGVRRLSVDLENCDCKLEMLRLENCGVTDEGCAALGSVLKSNPLNLREINLGWNKIGDLGVQSLFAAMENPNCKLEVLGLRDCKITDEAYADLVSTLKSNPSPLKELDLSQNVLRIPGIKHLSSVLENPNCKLEILRLESCGITDEGCAVLVSALRSNPSHLRELNLYMNHIGRTGGQLLSDMKEDPNSKLDTLKC